MSIIEKKTWPEYFNNIKENKKHFEVRLADFRIKKGDTMILREWHPKRKKYTGMKLKFKAGFIFKIPKDVKKFHSEADIKKFGFYVIELKK
jgi:ASC-1-like (ASCH) protein